MSRCQFSLQARIDLLEIHDFVAADSVGAAARLVDRLEEACQSLAKHPELGQRREDLAPSLRCFSVGNYAIFYRRLEDGIEVARAISGARHFPALFCSGP